MIFNRLNLFFPETILEELEVDNDDQATLQCPKIFQGNKSKRLINTRFVDIDELM